MDIHMYMYLFLKGEGHSKKRTLFVITNTKFILS